MIPMYVIKKESTNPLDSFSLKIIKESIATNIGAEFTIIVALETDVIVILKCHKVKSVVKAREASAVYKIVFLLLTLKVSLLLIK